MPRSRPAAGRRRGIVWEESLVVAAELLPDLVLMDVNLPGIDGLATRRLLGRDYRRVVLLLSTYDEDADEHFVAKSGAAAVSGQVQA